MILALAPDCIDGSSLYLAVRDGPLGAGGGRASACKKAWDPALKRSLGFLHEPASAASPTYRQLVAAKPQKSVLMSGKPSSALQSEVLKKVHADTWWQVVLITTTLVILGVAGSSGVSLCSRLLRACIPASGPASFLPLSEYRQFILRDFQS